MIESQAAISRPRTTVRLVSEMPTETLAPLLNDYTQRLDSVTKILFDKTQRRSTFHSDLSDKDDLARDVRYLLRRVEDLVNRASAMRESSALNEADNLNIELRIFDAETAMRLAAELLKRIA